VNLLNIMTIATATIIIVENVLSLNSTYVECTMESILWSEGFSAGSGMRKGSSLIPAFCVLKIPLHCTSYYIVQPHITTLDMEIFNIQWMKQDISIL